MKVLDSSGQLGFAKRQQKGNPDDTPCLNPIPVSGDGAFWCQEVRPENQANTVTACHVISTPGLCRALGVNSYSETAQMWTLQVPSSLVNLQAGRMWPSTPPECTVSSSNHKSQSHATCGQAGTRWKKQNGALCHHHRRTQEGVLKDIW